MVCTLATRRDENFAICHGRTNVVSALKDPIGLETKQVMRPLDVGGRFMDPRCSVAIMYTTGACDCPHHGACQCDWIAFFCIELAYCVHFSPELLQRRHCARGRVDILFASLHSTTLAVFITIRDTGTVLSCTRRHHCVMLVPSRIKTIIMATRLLA